MDLYAAVPFMIRDQERKIKRECPCTMRELGIGKRICHVIVLDM